MQCSIPFYRPRVLPFFCRSHKFYCPENMCHPAVAARMSKDHQYFGMGQSVRMMRGDRLISRPEDVRLAEVDAHSPWRKAREASKERSGSVGDWIRFENPKIEWSMCLSRNRVYAQSLQTKEELTQVVMFEGDAAREPNFLTASGVNAAFLGLVLPVHSLDQAANQPNLPKSNTPHWNSFTDLLSVAAQHKQSEVKSTRTLRKAIQARNLYANIISDVLLHKGKECQEAIDSGGYDQQIHFLSYFNFLFFLLFLLFLSTLFETSHSPVAP